MRPRATFRNWVTRDGTAAPTGAAGFAAAPGRYHLYVSLACPWAHRTLIMRALKGLEDLVSLSVAHWRMLDHGWTFEDGPEVISDPVLGAATRGVGGAVLTESVLSYLGLGVQPPTPSWGNILNEGRVALGVAWFIAGQAA